MRRPVNSPYLARLERIEAAARKLLHRIETDIDFENVVEPEPGYAKPNYGVFAPADDWKTLVEALKDE